MNIKVKTQHELENALKTKSESDIIELCGNGEFVVSGSAQVRVYGSAQVAAYGSAQVTATDSAQVRAYDSAQVTAGEDCAVTIHKPGSTPSAPDWDGGKEECGYGLHFSPLPFLAVKFDPSARKYVACPVLVSEIVVHENAAYPDKVKAPRVYQPTWEVDIDGNPIIGEKS